MTYAEYYMIIGSCIAMAAFIICWLVWLCWQSRCAFKDAQDEHQANDTVPCPETGKRCGCAKHCSNVIKRDRHYSEK